MKKIVRSIFKLFANATAFIFTLAFSFTLTFASQTSGTIDATYHNAVVCNDGPCSSQSTINFLPTGATAISIADINGVTANITGNAWGSTLGWINMSPTGYGVSVNIATGAVSGYAYSQVSGWINFAPTSYGVTIDASGNFNGYAWTGGENGGWIKFDCTGPSTAVCVRTDWRPTAGRTVVPSGGGGGGGGGGGYVIPTGTSTTNVVNIGGAVTQSGPQNQTTDYAPDYRSDVDDSGLIDVFDYNLLMVNWGKTTTVDTTKSKQDRCKTVNKADVNCDGKVDILDFNLVMINWLKKLPGRQSTP
jgi:hypothetical protein